MSTDESTSGYTCSVCNEGVTAAMSAECNWCDRRFHLNQRNDIESKDCGTVWIDEQYLALQFACNTCLADTDRQITAPPSTPDQPGQSPRPPECVSPIPLNDDPVRRRYRRRA